MYSTQLRSGDDAVPRASGLQAAWRTLVFVGGQIGLLLRSHETAAPALHVSLVAAVLYGAAKLFDRTDNRAAAILGIATGLLALTHSWMTPLMMMIAFIIIALLRYRPVLKKLRRLSMTKSAMA